MKINEYLEAKYCMYKPTTMLACEARVFGIPYPLKNGWRHKYGNIEISKEVAIKLREVLEKSSKDSASDGIKVLDKAWLVLKTAVAADSKDFLASKEWKRLRLEALKKNGSRCQCCGAGPSSGAVLNVDHIKPRKLFPELALHIDNLQVLCGECNEGKGNWDMTDFRT
jgi:hypothetical protein